MLVGGQALNFWVHQLEWRSSGLAAVGRLTSKDIDFLGTARAAEECARLLGGSAKLATMDDNTPNTGIVMFVDEHGFEREIDFLGQVFGLKDLEVVRSSVPFDVPNDDGTPSNVTFRAMHPLHCLESRLHNVVGLRRSTALSLDQFRAAIQVLLAFQALRLDDDEDETRVRDVLRANERLFFVARKQEARTALADHGIDVFDAVSRDERLPAAFHEKRYPQMRQILGR